jgi:protein CpxP
MKKNIILYIIIAVLLIVNAFFINLHLNAPKNKRDRDPSHFISEQLEFNDTQLVAFKELSEKHHKKLKIILDHTRTSKDNLFSNISNPNFDSTQVALATNKIGELEAQRDAISYTFFKSVLKICNAEQKTIFKDLIKKGLSGPNKTKR